MNPAATNPAERRRTYTFLLSPGSQTRGELHYESPRTQYVKNLGPATLLADGYLLRADTGYLTPEQFRVLPALVDRVVASAHARASKLHSTVYSEAS